MLTVALWGLATFAVAQSPSTSLRGTISDPSGAVISAAQVSLLNSSNGFSQKRTTDASGAYQFQQLPPGTYTVAVVAAGFSTQSKSIELMINQPAALNFSLAVEAEATTVSVSV